MNVSGIGHDAPAELARPEPDEAGAAEYEALHTGAVVVDRSDRSRATFSGAKRGDVLTGLVSNDVLSLAPSTGQYAAALTPKGKMIADVRIFARTDDLLVDVPPRAAEGWWSMVRKFVNPRLSKYADVTSETADVSVFGPAASSLAARATGIERSVLDALPPYGHHEGTVHGERATVARIPDLGVSGFALFLPAGQRDAALASLIALGAVRASRALVTLARIEAGRPEWGYEMDEATIPQEANFDELHAISYTKGCYTGQETVARVHFRGHVNRRLMGLAYDASHGVPAGASLVDATGKTVGDVRSVATSPRLGGVGIVMVRREVEAERDVDAQWPEGSASVRVVALPLGHGSNAA